MKLKKKVSGYSSDEDDNHVSEHSNSDSELSNTEFVATDSTHDSETDDEDNIPLMDRIHTSTTKNGCKWYNNMPPQNVCRGAHNIVTHVLGVKGPAKSNHTTFDIWCCLISDVT